VEQELMTAAMALSCLAMSYLPNRMVGEVVELRNYFRLVA